MRSFDDVPAVDDTLIQSRKTIRLEHIDARFEKWLWEGIYGESLIFSSEDVADLSDSALRAFVGNSSLAKHTKSMTLKRQEKYTYVNFNFRS